MLVAVSSQKLGFEFRLGQPTQEVIDGLTEKFIEKFGEETYTKAAKIIVVENHFFNIIKDRYGPTIIGEHNDFLEQTINAHLLV